jgi:hypothetical protein
MTTTLANQLPRINLAKQRIDAKRPSRDSKIWTTERFLGRGKIANAVIEEAISTDMSASVCKSSPLGRKTGYPEM